MFKSLLYFAVACTAMVGSQGASGATSDQVFHKIASEKSGGMLKAPDAEDAETWKAVGQATWVEGPSDGYSASFSGQRWVVDVEESESVPGRYRMVPYGEGSYVSDLLWIDCDEYFYVNTQDPERVYCEDYSHLLFEVSQLVPENGWQDVAIYGSIEDHVVSFPAKSFGVSEDGETWVYSNVNGNFTIYLPGANVVDYSFAASVTPCGDNEEIVVGCTSGKDIAAVKIKAYEGTVTANDKVYAEVAQSGEEIAANGETVWTADEAGKYTLCVVAVDGEGVVRSSDYHVVFIQDDDADNWEPIGSGTFTDPILPALGYDTAQLSEPQTFDVAVERNKSDHNLLRVVDPYVNHPFFVRNKRFLSSHSHHHYIYIDATDPDYVVVAESPTGVDLGYGQVCVNSPAAWYGAEHSKDEIEKYYGAVKLSDGVITFKAQTLFASETGEQHNALFRTICDGRLELPSTSGIADVAAEGDGEEATYYNLQGVKVDNPEPGTLMICRRGSHVTKVVVR